jgi:hypothetical protein
MHRLLTISIHAKTERAPSSFSHLKELQEGIWITLQTQSERQNTQLQAGWAEPAERRRKEGRSLDNHTHTTKLRAEAFGMRPSFPFRSFFDTFLVESNLLRVLDVHLY